jgi:hypothetical protein
VPVSRSSPLCGWGIPSSGKRHHLTGQSVFDVWKEHGRLKIDLICSFETSRADNPFGWHRVTEHQSPQKYNIYPSELYCKGKSTVEGAVTFSIYLNGNTAYEHALFPMYLAQTVHEDAKVEVQICVVGQKCSGYQNSSLPLYWLLLTTPLSIFSYIIILWSVWYWKFTELYCLVFENA